MTPILYLFLAYVLGATPTSFWVGRFLFDVDLKKQGSGNLGATNTYRILGWKAAAPVALFDILKGWFPVWFFPQHDHTATWSWILGYAAAAILGHVFSFWVGFRGGKGIATSAGAFLGLAPWAFLVALGVWIGVVLTTRIVSLASLSAAVALPASLLFLPHRGGATLFFFTLILSAFVFWAHRANIGRLLKGEENRFSGRNGSGAGKPETAGRSGGGPASEKGTRP
ncbi:MAG: glycerol-3-phosphate 1-O-acyltransferase PlsY [Gemmatimonadota bacterium]